MDPCLYIATGESFFAQDLFAIQVWKFQIVVSKSLIANGSTFLCDGGLQKRKRGERSTRYQSLLQDYIRQSTYKTSKYIAPPFVVLVVNKPSFDYP